MFNGHMDTSNTGREDFLTGIGYKPNAVVKNGMIYGLGIYNMKGALVCYTHAVQALQRAGVKLKGDVIIAAVAGEIEKTQWGEFKGKEYRGYGCRHALPGEPRHRAGYVHFGRAHRHAACAGTLWIAMGAHFLHGHLRSHRFLRRAGRNELHSPHART